MRIMLVRPWTSRIMQFLVLEYVYIYILTFTYLNICLSSCNLNVRIELIKVPETRYEPSCGLSLSKYSLPIALFFLRIKQWPHLSLSLMRVCNTCVNHDAWRHWLVCPLLASPATSPGTPLLLFFFFSTCSSCLSPSPPPCGVVVCISILGVGILECTNSMPV